MLQTGNAKGPPHDGSDGTNRAQGREPRRDDVRWDVHEEPQESQLEDPEEVRETFDTFAWVENQPVTFVSGHVEVKKSRHRTCSGSSCGFRPGT